MAKKKIGVGAVCRTYVRFMHPSKLMRDKFVNIGAQLKISDLVSVKQEVKKVNRKDQMCVIFRHDNWPNKEIYCCKRWVTVLQEGNPAHFFDVAGSPVENETGTEENPNVEEDNEPIPDRVFHMSGSNAEDIAHVRSLGLGVDDDNDPAPENVPTGAHVDETDQFGG